MSLHDRYTLKSLPVASFVRLGAFLLIFVAAVVCTRSATAHEKPSYPVDGADGNLAVTVPLLVNASPIIDGALGEGEWDKAVKLAGFRRCWTFRGTPAAVQTTAYLMGADGRLYVAFKCEIDDASKLQASETREDARLFSEDHVRILLDTLHDHRRVIELGVSAGGSRYDKRWGNSEWDAVWDTAVKVYESCYIVEIDLDLNSLTYEKQEGQTFGINLIRSSMDPYEVTGWMVDERLGAEDSRCFPHLAGLLLPEKLAERSAKVDTYVVAMNESKSGAEGSSVQAGVDVEYPLTPSVTSRFTLFPDLTNVEASFESIDVSYREQFLPDTRDFFVNQAEFFPERKLFHSGRIGDFEGGAKITGAWGDYRLGILDAYGKDESQNDFVTHVTRQLDQHTDAKFSLVDVRKPDFYGTTLAGGFGTDFKDDSHWHLDLDHAHSLSDVSTREGHQTSAGLLYKGGHGQSGGRIQYEQVSPNFDPISGFNPRRGFRKGTVNAWKLWEPEQGSRFYRSYELFSHYGQGETWGADFYARDYGVGGILNITDRDRIGLIANRDRHLEENIRPEPFDDRTLTLIGNAGRGKDVSGRASYKFGTVEDSRLNQYSVNLDWRKPAWDLRTDIGYSQRRQDFDNGPGTTAEIIEVGLTWLLSAEHWLSLRWFTRSGDKDIDNLSMTYRIHKASGNEFFLILGDPLAQEIRERIAAKYIHRF
ncbi:MAG: hypothetical protein ISS70_02495 [Phycisphaerae bacterium]|nr:hypothetical protein [Phycisphaerae bacterium]